MTKKDFILQANTVKLIENKALRKEQAEFLADINAKSNPRFNKDIFLKACGVK